MCRGAGPAADSWAGRAASVVFAEAARVPSWTEPCPCVSLRRRVVDLHERVRTYTLASTLTLAT